MARQKIPEARFDARGGVNTAFSDELLDSTEVRRAQNARSYDIGAWNIRAGSQRLHATQLEAGALLNGLTQWDPAAGRELVAISNGKLHHKTYAGADFTTETPVAPLSTAAPSRFARYRAGVDIQLWIASDGLYRWDGAALSEPSDFPDAPAALDVTVYKGRGFVSDGSKRLYWSKRGDLSLWSASDGGGFADVETFDAEGIMAICTVGSSLLIAKEDNIARYTGVSIDDVRIDTEQEGVSSEVGIIAPQTFVQVDEAAFGLSVLGPFIVTESGIQFVDLKVGREFDFANRAQMAGAAAAYNRARREVWLFIPANGDADNETCWIFNRNTQTWNGPFLFPYGGSAIARYKRDDEAESVVIGGYDGWVRDGDVEAVGAVDDVLADGTGGTNVTLEIEYPPAIGGNPGTLKSIRQRQTLAADLGTAGKQLTAAWASEMGNGSVDITSVGPGLTDYPFKWTSAKGKRIVRTFTYAGGELVEIAGIKGDLTLSRPARG